MKGKITISRTSDDTVRICIKDNASVKEFVDVSLTLEQYGSLVSGLSHIDCEFKVRDLDKVGKVRQREARSIVLPNNLSKEEVQDVIKNTKQEEGYILDTYLGSQTSRTYNQDGTTTHHYYAIKYIESTTK